MLRTAGRGRVAGRDGRFRFTNPEGLTTFRLRGGAVVEPWLPRIVDLSSLWHIDERGEPHLLGSTAQQTTGSGIYRGCNVVMTDLGPSAGTIAWDDLVVERARVVVEAAAAASYRGPCGVDAFIYGDNDTGRPTLRGAVELNARFTAGHVALGLIADDPRRLRATADGRRVLDRLTAELATA